MREASLGVATAAGGAATGRPAPAQPGRPRSVGRRPSTSRPQLERTAFALFEQQGFDETSVEDIAAAAGIGRRTFFRYFPSKLDVVWGDFEHELDRLRAWFAQAPPGLPMMSAVHQAVLEFNRLAPEQELPHRRRMELILGVPTLLANSTLRFAQWRAVVAEFAAGRLGTDRLALLPSVIGYTALGASLAAYDQWLRDDTANLTSLLDEALGELALGFRHRGAPR